MQDMKEFVHKLYSKATNDTPMSKKALVRFFSHFEDGGFSPEYWPYDLTDLGLEMSSIYIKQIDDDKNHPHKVKFAMGFSDKNGEEVLNCNTDWGCNLDGAVYIELRAMKKSEKLNVKNFSWEYVKKHKRLLDKMEENTRFNKFMLDAYASNREGEAVGNYYGSLVWATRGFNFNINQCFMDQIRGDFKKFTQRRGIKLTKKDLLKFTRPYHFACFRPDIKEEVKFRRGNNEFETKMIPIGRKFMLQHARRWRGVIYGGDKSNQEYEFAKLYNEVDKKQAICQSNIETDSFNLKQTNRVIVHNFAKKFAKSV